MKPVNPSIQQKSSTSAANRNSWAKCTMPINPICNILLKISRHVKGLLPVFRWIFSHRRKNRIFPLQAASAVYKAVPFLGIKKAFVSAFSNVSSLIFRSIPPAYPVRLPFVPTTRWQGTIIEISLWPTAPPTAWADMCGSPFWAASCFAISP